MLRSACLAAALSVLVTGASWAQSPNVALTIRDHRFEPAELTVPAGQQIELHVTNAGKVPAEFESSALRREKVLPAGHKVVIHVGPLQPGRYEFFDDFHPTTRGHLVAR